MQEEPVDEFRLRQIVDHLPFFATIIDRECRFLWVSRVDATLRLEQVLGARVHDFLHPSSLPSALETIEQSFATATVGHYKARGYGEGNMATWYGATVVPLPVDPQGRARALLLSHDITKQHAAEVALLESERRFRMLTESSPDLVSIVDRDYRVRYLNRDLPPEAGITRSNILGRSIAELMNTDSSQEALRVIEGVFNTGIPATFEAQGPLDQRTYLCRVLRLSSDNADTAEVLITTTDVTEQRRAEAERADLAFQLQQSQKLELIGQLAGGVAHDFNNFLVVVHNHAEFAKIASVRGDDPVPEIDAIIEASERAAGFTRGLLTIGRKQPYKPDVFSLSEFLNKRFKVLRRLLPESIQFVLDMPEEAGYVHADPGQVEQILLNAVLNARDAVGSSGQIKVAVIRRSGESGDTVKHWLELSCTDDGRGMDEATLARAFDPFFTTKPVGQGTGLGLPMVLSLATQNRARTTLSSQLGTSTRLAICFPEVSKDQIVEHPVKAETALVAGGGATILVAEDNPAVRDVVARILEGAGYRVLLASNGLEAVELCRVHGDQIALAVLDAVMPVMGGKEAFERIHKLQPGMKTLFCSGYSAEELPQLFLDQNELPLLPKPFPPRLLLSTVERILRGASLGKLQSRMSDLPAP